MFNKTKLKAAEATIVQFEAALLNAQRTVEVMGASLTQKDNAFIEFIDQIHNVMGGTMRITSEADAMKRLRELRAHADQYVAIREVLAGRFDPDAQLLKQIACAAGCSQFDIDSLRNRVSHLAGVLGENVKLSNELRAAKAKIEELEGNY